jgi:hypothetical protein
MFHIHDSGATHAENIDDMSCEGPNSCGDKMHCAVHTLQSGIHTHRNWK